MLRCSLRCVLLPERIPEPERVSLMLLPASSIHSPSRPLTVL